MKSSVISLIKHLLLFILIEVIFVLLLFRELPETNLLTTIGILHTSYRLVLIVSGRIRQQLNKVWQKFLCSYLPIVYHVVVHIYIGLLTLETHGHDEHSLTRIIMGALLLGVLIAGGERYLHRALHCQTHHTDAHQHCKDDCEHLHKGG